MARHQVGNKILLFADFLVYFVKFIAEFFVLLYTGLAHVFKDIVAYVFGSNLKLTTYVMLTQFAEKCIIFICYKVIVTNTASYKYLFHTGKIAELSEKLEIILMAYLGIGTNCREKTLLITAGACLKLFCAGGCAEICRRTTYVVNISLEIFFPNEFIRFCKDGLLASSLNDSALMERKSAETTASKTPA